MTSTIEARPHDETDAGTRTRPIEIVLVDDHAILRQGLRSVLEREADIAVVGEAGTPDDAAAVVAATRPDLVLLDLKLSSAPGLEGLDLCERLTGLDPAPAVLILTSTLEDAIVVAALRRGARGYVVKDVDTTELLRAIRAVDAGHNAFDSLSASAMVRGLNASSEIGAHALTTREMEVLRLLAKGMSNRGIARTLFVSESTAKFHVANIMRKLGVTRRAEAVYVASKTGTV